MLRPVMLIHLLSALGLALVGLVTAHHPPPASAQASANTLFVAVDSVTADDPNDTRFPATYNYFLTSMPRIIQEGGVTNSASGSQTYQAYSDADGSILDTETVGNDGSVDLTVPANVAYHVININDPGNGTDVISAGNNPLVTVVINTPDVSSIGQPDSGNAATAPTTTPAPPTATPRTPRPTSTATSSADTVPTATSTAAAGGQGQNGMRAAIYAGTCGSDVSGKPVATLSDVAAPDGTARGGWVAVVANLLRQPNNQWWDDASTDGVIEDRDMIIGQAMRAARDELTQRSSVVPERWAWGKLHQLELRSPTFGTSGVGLVRRIFNRGPFRVGGGEAIVDATAWDAARGYEVTSAPSMRMVVDLDDLDRSRWVNLTGESGHAASSHYRDQTTLWLAGRTLPWASSPEAVRAATDRTLVLEPAG